MGLRAGSISLPSRRRQLNPWSVGWRVRLLLLASGALCCTSCVPTLDAHVFNASSTKAIIFASDTITIPPGRWRRVLLSPYPADGIRVSLSDQEFRYPQPPHPPSEFVSPGLFGGTARIRLEADGAFTLLDPNSRSEDAQIDPQPPGFPVLPSQPRLPTA